jgi:inward rectifier potassium channel
MLERFKKSSTTDPGLGEIYNRKTKRVINQDGTFNVVRKGMKSHLYQDLIDMDKWKFFSLLILLYLVLNGIFAAIYTSIGIDSLGGTMVNNSLPHYVHAFFFSMQTFTTVGFGAIFPKDPATNFIAGMEAMAGLLFFALATGMVYGRFSKPSAKILFSKNALISPFKEGNALMLRLVNRRANVLMDMDARVFLVLAETSESGTNRKYYSLKLEIDSIAFFPLSWTLVHAIDEDSPLNGLTHKEMRDMDAEVIVLLRGFDETFGQQVQARYSYVCGEMIWGAKFVKNFSTDENGEIILDIEGVHLFEKTVLN